MPSLEEMKRWLSGEDVDGMPPNRRPAKENEEEDTSEPTPEIIARHMGLNLDKMRKLSKLSASPKYTISISGQDAILHFGKHNGLSLSQIKDKGDTSYLDWLLKQDFSPHLKDVICWVLKKDSVKASIELHGIPMASKKEEERIEKIVKEIKKETEPPTLFSGLDIEKLFHKRRKSQ